METAQVHGQLRLLPLAVFSPSMDGRGRAVQEAKAGGNTGAGAEQMTTEVK